MSYRVYSNTAPNQKDPFEPEPEPENEDVNDGLTVVERRQKEYEAKRRKIITTVYNSNVDPARQAEANTRPYTQVQKCTYCKEDYDIVFRQSDERYSPVKDKMVSNVNKYDYPIWVPLDATSQRDRWNNYCDLTGKPQIHLCNVDKMGDQDFRRYVEHMFEMFIEHIKRKDLEIKQLQEECVRKEFVVDNVTYQEA
jgi:hypothetical protein